MANNQYNLSKEYQFDITVTDNTYAGKLALPYVTAAVKSPDTVARGYVRQIDGLNRKAVISNLAVANPIVAGPGGTSGSAACGFQSGGDTTLSEQVLTLVDLKVNEEICRGTIFPTWIGENMDRNGNLPASFEDFLLASVAGRAGQQLENGIWVSDASAGAGSTGLFGVGFLSNDGTFDQDGLNNSLLKDFPQVTMTSAGGGITAANAAKCFGDVYNTLVANSPGVLSKPDVAFYCNLKTYGMYMQHLAGAGALTNGGYNNEMTNQSFTTVSYLGLPINVCPGMPDDCIVLTYKDNLVFGTNLATDYTEARIIPTYQYDGSDNVRIVMNFAMGMQVAMTTDGVVGVDF